MNLSSIFGHITPEVEEICRTMKQQTDDDDAINEEGRREILSKLPDDFLDLDLKYAKQSLQTYKEAIKQQKRARLQCLHLLLQSRCSFGSMDAARILFGKDKNVEDVDVDTNDSEQMPNIDDILDKLKMRKEALSDALALEGLDVEEDAEEEKKLEKEAKDIVPFTWFIEEDKDEGQGGEAISTEIIDGSDEGPAAKKVKL